MAGEGYRGSATGEAQWLISPRTTGQGITVPLPSVGRRWTIGRRCGRMGARQTAGSGRVSDAMARLSKRRCGSQRGDTIADRPPWETPGPPSYAARRSADISVLFLVPYRDRAATFALPGQCSGITRVISAWRQKHMPPLSPTTTTVLCLAASVHLVCRPRPW